MTGPQLAPPPAAAGAASRRSRLARGGTVTPRCRWLAGIDCHSLGIYTALLLPVLSLTVGMTAPSLATPTGELRQGQQQQLHGPALPALRLRSGRIVASDIEVPNMLANPVCRGRAAVQATMRPSPSPAAAAAVKRSAKRAPAASGVSPAAFPARAGNRRFWLLSALRAHTKAP
jgi:hypothetical protein